MLRDVVSLDELPSAGTYGEHAVRAFLGFIEKRTGGRFFYDKQQTKLKEHLAEALQIAARLQAAGVIHKCAPLKIFCDEPRMPHWHVSYGSGKHPQLAGGIAIESDRAALIPALAEALERYLWFEAEDYFLAPRTASVGEIGKKGAFLDPRSFAGFSREQRAENQKLTLTPDAQYLWIQGRSLTDNARTWIPAQVISGHYGPRVSRGELPEPLILSPITTGLATGPSRNFALLSGILEILERDAFMITWLNRLTPPRLDLTKLAEGSQNVAVLLDTCRRYRLQVDVALLPTDAPTYAVCSVVRDERGGPEVTVGLKANRSLERAAIGATLEALRMRQTVRLMENRGVDVSKKAPKDLNHMERAQYWARGGRSETLKFLIEGNFTLPTSDWSNDPEDEHLARIVEWCRSEGYPVASVDLGRSAKNPTDWKVEMVVMPDAQPLHQNERRAYRGGARLKHVPRKCGYAALDLYNEEPHPFA